MLKYNTDYNGHTQTLELNKFEEVTVKFNSYGTLLIEYRVYSELFDKWLLVDLDLYERTEPEQYKQLLADVAQLEPKAA